jgi:hypothetical protein
MSHKLLCLVWRVLEAEERNKHWYSWISGLLHYLNIDFFPDSVLSTLNQIIIVKPDYYVMLFEIDNGE